MLKPVQTQTECVQIFSTNIQNPNSVQAQRSIDVPHAA